MDEHRNGERGDFMKYRTVRAEDVSTLRAVTQMGRAVHVWGAIGVGVIGFAVWAGMQLGQFATKGDVAKVADNLNTLTQDVHEIHAYLLPHAK